MSSSFVARRLDLQILASAAPVTSASRPGSMRHSRTRLARSTVTRRDACDDFFGEDNVPAQALTMGVGTILESRRSPSGFVEHKAPIVQKAAEETRTEAITAASCRNTRIRRSCRPRGPPGTDAGCAALGHGFGPLDECAGPPAVIWLSLKVQKGRSCFPTTTSARWLYDCSASMDRPRLGRRWTR